MKPKILLLVLLLLVACSPTRGCVASYFTLEPQSRLPKWFSVPDGYTRDQVTVYLYYYSSPFPVDDAVFELTDLNGKKLTSVTGRMCWHPETDKKRNQPGGFSASSVPYYIYVRANGILEVIEHRERQTFRVSDDPQLIREATESKECRK